MDWNKYIEAEKDKDYFKQLSAFIKQQEQNHTIFPNKDRVFACFNYFNIADTKVVIVGQDPYQTPGYANGLCFAVNKGVETPKSLINIFKELESDLGIKHTDTTLVDWASQGVLLLNRVLTVNSGLSNSHRNKGWEEFTNHMIRLVNDKANHVVFVLWGNNAQELEELIDQSKHLVIKTSHPSPLGYYRSFKGSKPFSKINDYLAANGKEPIKW